MSSLNIPLTQKAFQAAKMTIDGEKSVIFTPLPIVFAAAIQKIGLLTLIFWKIGIYGDGRDEIQDIEQRGKKSKIGMQAKPLAAVHRLIQTPLAEEAM